MRSAAIRPRPSMPASTSAAPSSSPSASPGWSPGSAGYLWVSRYVVAYVEIASGYELNIIAACVIGGISIAGGIGSVGGTVLGALFLGIIKTALPVINISPFWQMAISGTAIILAVVAQRARRAQARAAHPAERRRRLMSDIAAAPRPRASPTGSTSRLRSALLTLGGAAARRGGRDLHRQHLRLALFPRRLDPLRRDLQFHREGDDRACHGAADHRRRDRPFGRRHHRARLDRDGHGACRPASVRRCWWPIGLGVGLACGAFNGLLVTGLGLPSIVVTIGTMSLFRGISFIILGDQAYKGYPASFAFFGQGYVWWVFSFELVLFLARGAGLRLPAAPHEFRPRASLRSATTRSPRSSPASGSAASSSSCSA